MAEEILEKLKDSQNLVVVYSGGNFFQASSDLIKKVSENFEKICLINANDPVENLLERFEKLGVDSSKFIFFDLVSNKKTNKIQNCIYLSSPENLTSISLEMGKILNKIDLIIVDNLSSLLVHNKAFTLTRFMHDFILKIRNSKAKAIYTILERDFKGDLNSLELFADGIVFLGKDSTKK